RQVLEDPLLRDDRPVVGDGGQWTIGVAGRRLATECPDPAADEVPFGFKLEAGRRLGLGDREPPAQGVRQEPLGPEVDDLADATRITGRYLVDREVDGRPPTRQGRS